MRLQGRPRHSSVALAVSPKRRQGIGQEILGGGETLQSANTPSAVHPALRHFLPLRRRGGKVASDDRILGSGEFIERLRAEAAHQERDRLRLARKVVTPATVERTLCTGERLAAADLHAGRRTRRAVQARRLFCHVAVRGMGYSGAAVARFLGVTTSAVTRLAASDDLPQTRTYLKAL